MTTELATINKAKKLMSKASVQSATLEDLARYLGFLLGYEGKTGGWVYNGDNVVGQGWTAVGKRFMKIGWIKKSSTKLFINWMKIPNSLLG